MRWMTNSRTSIPAGFLPVIASRSPLPVAEVPRICCQRCPLLSTSTRPMPSPFCLNVSSVAAVHLLSIVLERRGKSPSMRQHGELWLAPVEIWYPLALQIRFPVVRSVRWPSNRPAIHVSYRDPVKSSRPRSGLGSTNIWLLKERLLSSMTLRLGWCGRLLLNFGHKAVPRFVIHGGRELWQALKCRQPTWTFWKPRMQFAIGTSSSPRK